MKFIGYIFKIFFVLMFIMFIGVISTIITPFLTAEKYEKDKTPSNLFRVIVEVNDNKNNKTILRSIPWDEFTKLKQNKDYKIYSSKSNGKCSNISFWCQATNVGPQKQIIELRYAQENFRLYNKYYVNDGKIEPIYFRIMDRGHAVLSVFISFIFAPIILLSFRFCVKKLKTRKEI